MLKCVPTWGKVRAAACVVSPPLVPAVVYGGDKKPLNPISMLAKEVAKLLENEAAYSHIIELNIGGTKQNVIIKALQRHPSKGHACTLTSSASWLARN